MYDAETIRADSPILARRVGEEGLVYPDNAATSQKPRAVLDALKGYYEEHNANIHRLAEEATAVYEGGGERRPFPQPMLCLLALFGRRPVYPHTLLLQK